MEVIHYTRGQRLRSLGPYVLHEDIYDTGISKPILTQPWASVVQWQAHVCHLLSGMQPARKYCGLFTIPGQGR